MVRVIDLTSQPLDDALLGQINGAYAIGDTSIYDRVLTDRGIQLFAMPPQGVPDEATLVLFPAVNPIARLVSVVDRLLGPGGCPWDQAQTHESLKRYLIEESYEVLDAIDSGDRAAMAEELGDLLLQPILHGQMSARDGSFTTDDIAKGITEKLIRRHPHVFGDISVADADEVLKNWDQIKKQEKDDPDRSILGGVPGSMPALLRAYEVSKRAARVGFEWPNINAVVDKLHEEEAEFMSALEAGDQAEIEAELGDILFTVVNVARWAKVEPEEALRQMLNRFVERFVAMERTATKSLRDLTPDEWDALWVQAKASTKKDGRTP